MIVHRNSLLAVILPAILVTTHATRAALSGSWNGTWSGTLGGAYPWPVSITISQGKVASFSEKGMPFDVRCTKVTLTAVSFGDQAGYSTILTKIGDATASVRIHGRDGFVAGSLTKQ
jgi:hypothetical protein